MNKPYDVIKIDKNTKKIQTPNLLLTTRSFNVIGKISNFNNWKISLVGNGVDEISFDVHKYVNGKLCPIWDDLVDLKIVQVMEFGNFEISVDYTDNTETVKAVHGKSLEVELAQIPLNDFHVNDDEAKTMKQTEYNAIDFDENGNFIPTTFYNPKDKNHSLLHRVLKDKAQHWSIGEVTPYIAIDEETQRELSSTFQRTYTCDGTSIYDFLTGDVAKESNVIFIFDTLHRKINCYSLCDCVDLETGDIYKGIGEDTTVFVSKRKLTNEITINSNKDNVKNCFRVEGGDDTITTMIGAVNMNGSNYIYQFADFQYNDMSKELVEKIKAYQKMISSQELQDEYYGYGDIKRFINGTLTLNVRSEDEAALALALCSSNNVSTGTANIMTYINTPYWYVIDGKRGKELCVSSTKTTPLLYATTAYNTMGIYPKLCVQYDMLEYFESSMMPSVTISDTTAEEQYTLMKNNLTSEDTVVGIYSCGNYSDSAFLGVTDNVVAMANVVIDARYKAEVIKDTTSYTKVDDHNYTWTGNIKITRVTDETDYYPKTDADSKFTFSVKISDDELIYTKQKIEKALSKGSMLDIDFDVAEMNKTEIRNYFNKYSLNMLNGFQEGYNNCLSILMSMPSDSDIKDTLYKKYNIRFDIVSKLYTNRKKQVSDVNDAINNLDVERSNFIDEKKLRLQDYLGDKLYKEFSAYRREDSYKNDNYISDGYSTAQCLEKAKELLEVAQKEAKKACVLQRTVSCNLNNLFAIPEFEPLYDKLALFNYIRIRTEDEILKLRLIEVDFSGDSVDKIEVTFSEQIETVDGKTSDLESILQQASTMATSYSSTTLQAKKGEQARNKLLDLYYGGLNATNIMLSNNDNNEVTITSAGLIAKRMDDEGYYGDKQLRITGNGVYLTKDAWKHVEMAIGEVFFNGSWQYGVLAPLLVGKMIAGNNLVIQDENGTVKIDGNGIILSKGAKIKWSVDGSDGVKAPDIDDIKGLPKKLDGINDYLEQLDGRIQTFTQNTNPRDDSSWGDDSSHIGDLWVNPDTGITKQWTGNGWIEVTDSYLKSLAASKAQIFTEKPTVSYFKGDMLIPAKTFENNGRTYYAKKGYRALRNSNGTTFSNDDWDELDYTNDDAINNFIKGDYAETIEDIKTQVDGKARSWYQSEDPSLSWDKTEDHEGDLWYNTSTTSQVTSIYKNGGWQPTNVPKAVFDTIDGKRQIFVKKPDSILTASGNNVITNNISCKNGDTIVLECTTYTSIKASFYDSSDTEISVYLVRSSIPLAKTINIPIDAENVEYAIITINDSSKSDVKSLKVNGTEYIIPISYMTGDLWIISESDCTNGKITVNGVTYNSNSTLIAILPNNVTERTSFVESDWTDISTQDGIVALDQSTQALNKFDDIANDSKITPTEKQQLKILFENIEAEKVSIVNNCKEYSMDSLTSAYYSDYDAYISAFNNLETLFGTILSDMKSTINVPSNYSSVTKSYYDKYDVINTDIEKASKSYADKKSEEVDTKILYFQANVNKLLNADLPLTDTGDDYIFSPYIGGGYLYIEGDSGSVEINPKQEKKDYIGYSGDIFNVKNSSKTTVFNVSTSGQVTIRGGNSSNSIELDGKNGTIYTINGSHKSVLTSGKLYFYEDNKNVMTITPTTWKSQPTVKGTALHSELESKFISFGNIKTESDTSYTTNLVLNYGLNPYKNSDNPSDGTTDKDVLIYGSTWHSGSIYFYNDYYLSTHSTNNVQDGIFCSGRFHTETALSVGNTIYTNCLLSVDGSAYISGSLSISGTDVISALNGKASASHNHDGVYASINHNHAGVYANASHEHDLEKEINVNWELDGKSNNYKTAPVKGGGWRVASKAYVDAKVSCDERVKKDFTYLPSNIDTIFDSLTVKQYKFKEETALNKGYQFGDTAQHVNQIFDENGLKSSEYGITGIREVYEDEEKYIDDGKFNYINTDNLIWLCVDQIQKLKKQMSELQSEISILKNQSESKEV